MKNEKKVKRTKRADNFPTSSIVIDKLVFSCLSTVEDNFDYMVVHAPEYYYNDFEFGKTKLLRRQDPSNRYRHSYKVYYDKYLMGTLEFSLYNNGIYTNMLRFSVDNEVFYNGMLKYIPSVLNNLNLKINNFKQLDIAIDSYKYNAEQIIRCNMLDKNNNVKLFGKVISDRNKYLNERVFFNGGSLNNPYDQRSLQFKGKDGRKELFIYNKKREIDKVSNKEYILKFHKERNPKFRNIYRAEVRLGYEEISRYSKKIKRTITFEDLLDSQFLNDMFFEYLNRIITIYRGTGRKKTKIQLVDKPYIEQPQVLLQPTLPMHIFDFYNDNGNYKMKIDNENNILTILYDKNKYTLENIKYEIFIYKYNNLNKYLSIYEKSINQRPQVKDKYSHARC